MIFLSIQKVLPICLNTVLGAALIVAATGACATSRIGEAEVRDEDGVPCFAIAKKEEQRAGVPALGALAVHDATVKPVVRIWAFGLRPFGRSQPIPSNTCIRYGQTPTGSEITKAAAPLQIGKIYEVFLNASPLDTSDPTFGYDAKFCLLALPGGGLKVHQIVYNDGWRYEICGGR